jgi:hypothetical protein
MRIPLALGVVWILSASGAVSAQTQPFTNTPTNPPPAGALGAQTGGSTEVTGLQNGRSTGLGANVYPSTIYQMGDIGRSLNLTPTQISGLDQLTTATQKAYRDRFNTVMALPESERATRMDELNRQYATEWHKGARNIFNENQYSRYQQLIHQYGGFHSLTNPEIQKQLDLTPTQLRDVVEQRNWSNRQVQEINRVAATDPAKATQMYRDYSKQLTERMNSFLTPMQQQVWAQLTGEPYSFQANFGPQR